MNQKVRRREFVKTLGQAAAALSLAHVTGSSCGTAGKKRPNILWIAVEDASPLMSCYGYDINPTPNLDRLANSGVRFANTYMPAPVCSACRSALITGMMQTTLGLHNHHSSRSEETAIKLPDYIKTIPELFRAAGYFTFNHGKDDYNFWYNREDLYSGEYTTHRLYGKSGKAIDWNSAANGQPFFGQIQLRGGKHIYNKNFKKLVGKPVDRQALELPPYYPDNPMIRDEWANHLDSIQVTDGEMGQIVERLRADGLLEDTVIFFFTDHGMRLWRHKQFCYDGGLHVPFIVNWPADPEKLGGTGSVREDLVNGLDIAASSLALAGISIPSYMESRDLFAPGFESRDWLVSARDRCDYTIDRIRSIRTKRYHYIRNFLTDRSYMQPNYRDEWPITKMMRTLHAEEKLNIIQDRFWQDMRPTEEFYDLESDPHEINNLCESVSHSFEIQRHRDILKQWILDTNDRGQYPEDISNLKYMFDWWGEKCVNPEYDIFRSG